MRKLCLLIALVFVIAVPLWSQTSASARDYPRSELFGGFSYYNLDGQNIIPRENAYGWAAGISGNFHKNIGMALDVAGQYGDVNLPLARRAFQNVGFSSYQFLAGPRFSVRSEEASGFFHTLFGGAYARTPEGRETAPGAVPFNFTRSTTRFAIGVGGGADRNINRSVAIRIFQLDWIFVRSDPHVNNYRVQFGVVLRLGM